MKMEIWMFLMEGELNMAKTIMIVEDKQSFHDLYTAMLEDTDYEIVRAYDGDEAWEKLERKKPDLIILDIKLDLVDGDTFFLHLKDTPEYTNIPVIIVSNVPYRGFKSLNDVVPNLVIFDKNITKKKLVEEIRAKIG